MKRTSTAKSISNLAKRARLVNAQLIEVLSRPFPYKWSDLQRADFDGWRDQTARDWADRPLIVEGLKWLVRPIEEYGQDVGPIVPHLRSLLPLLYAAEQQNLSWIYVSTVASMFPILFHAEALFCIGAFGSNASAIAGSWAKEFMEACAATHPIYMEFFREDPAQERRVVLWGPSHRGPLHRFLPESSNSNGISQSTSPKIHRDASLHLRPG